MAGLQEHLHLWMVVNLIPLENYRSSADKTRELGQVIGLILPSNFQAGEFHQPSLNFSCFLQASHYISIQAK